MRIIQLVPGLPPQVDGIGDYALQLSRRLRDEQDIHTEFIVCNPTWDGASHVEGFRAVRLRSRTEAGFHEALSALRPQIGPLPPLLVQFAVYGYEKRGCPLWLATSLEGIHRQGGPAIHVAFHELQNRLWKPWKSAFWLRGLQSSIIRRVASVSRYRYTNTEDHRQRMSRWRIPNIELIPNFSTLGEPSANPPFAERRRDAVVFGRAAQREWTYQYGSHMFGAICARLGIERIVDIGSPIQGGAPERFGSTPVIRCGRLPADQVNRHMEQSLISFIHYPVPALTKSSVFAVSAAHGTVPFILDRNAAHDVCPPLQAGTSYLPVTGTTGWDQHLSLQALSESVFNDYRTRSSTIAAAKIAAGLRRGAKLL